MNLNFPLADVITRIRNGQQAKLARVKLNSSKLCLNVLNVLMEEGVIKGYSFKEEDKNLRSLYVELKYYKGLPVIKSIKVISKPSKRTYLSVKEIWKIDSGLGFLILSTSKGVISDKKARKFNVGGEVLCKVL